MKYSPYITPGLYSKESPLHRTILVIQTSQARMEFYLELGMIFGHNPESTESPESAESVEFGDAKEKEFNRNPRILHFRNMDALQMLLWLNANCTMQDYIHCCILGLTQSFTGVIQKESLGARIVHSIFPDEDEDEISKVKILSLDIYQYR